MSIFHKKAGCSRGALVLAILFFISSFGYLCREIQAQTSAGTLDCNTNGRSCAGGISGLAGTACGRVTSIPCSGACTGCKGGCDTDDTPERTCIAGTSFTFCYTQTRPCNYYTTFYNCPCYSVLGACGCSLWGCTDTDCEKGWDYIPYGGSGCPYGCAAY